MYKNQPINNSASFTVVYKKIEKMNSYDMYVNLYTQLLEPDQISHVLWWLREAAQIRQKFIPLFEEEKK